MRDTFIGRDREIAMLDKRLDWVRSGGNAVAISIPGRRQVGGVAALTSSRPGL